MLRKKNRGNQVASWSIDDIRSGFEEFFKVHNRYPTSRDFDSFEYLPTARSVQRAFGGLQKLRENLNIDQITNYTTGKVRSETAKNLFNNSKNYETKFYEYLVTHIPEVRVHEHKILRPGSICCDYFIYDTDISGFAIDLFFAKDLFSLKGIIRIKLDRYKHFKFPVYFVLVGNDSINQEEINLAMLNRKEKLPNNFNVLTEQSFKKLLEH